MRRNWHLYMCRMSMQHTQRLFYLYFIIMLFTKGLGLTDGPVYKACLAVASLAALTKILLERHNRREYVLIAVLLILGGANWIHTGNQGALLCILLVLSMKKIVLQDAFCVGAICWGTSYVLQIVTQLLNLRARDFVIHTKFGFRNIIRWGLGYTHPNVLQIATLALLAYIFYSTSYRTGTQLCILVTGAVALSVYIFIYSLSITGISMTIVFLLVLVYLEHNRFCGRTRSRIENILLQLIFPLSVSFAVLSPLVLTGSAFDLLNKVMQTRPTLSRYFMTTYGLSPLGGVYTDLPTSYTLDCSYVDLLMHGGWMLFAVMCIGYLWLVHRLILETPSRENSISLAVVLYTAVGAISEPFAFNTSYKNISLLILGWQLYHALQGESSDCKTRPAAGRISSAYNMVVYRLYHVLVRGNSHIVRMIAVGALCGILCAGLYGHVHHAPQEVYALREHGDDIEDYPFIYFTQEEVDNLRQMEGVWVMEYDGPDEIMIHYSGEGIGEIETVRSQISIGLFVTGVVYIILACIQAHNHKE